MPSCCAVACIRPSSRLIQDRWWSCWRREPRDEGGHHPGYIPRAKNEAIARLMDAGKLLFGRLESKEKQGTWLKAEMRVFMRGF